MPSELGLAPPSTLHAATFVAPFQLTYLPLLRPWLAPITDLRVIAAPPIGRPPIDQT